MLLDPNEMCTMTQLATWDEAERLAALHSYEVLDTPREDDFEDIAQVAPEICGAPIAFVNLVDTTHPCFKAEVGRVYGQRTRYCFLPTCAAPRRHDDRAGCHQGSEVNPLVTEARLSRLSRRTFENIRLLSDRDSLRSRL